MLTKRRNGSEFLIDCNVDNPESKQARRDLVTGNFETAERFITTSTDSNQRAYAFEALADWPGEPSHLASWLAQRPSSAAKSAAAIQKMKWAWEARGGAYAAHTSENSFASFASRLPVAREALLAVLAADRKDASVVPWLIWCSRGTGDTSLGEKAFAEGVRRAPELCALYSSMLLSHCAKWGGSDEAMFDFARQSAATAPATSGAAILLVEAHYYAFESTTPMSPESKGYWLQPAVVQDVLSANEACSGLSGMLGIRLSHWLAYGLWRCGRFALAKPHFAAIGKVPNERPWLGLRRGFNWLFGPFRKARRACINAS